MANLATEVKLYGRWSFEDVEVKDMSLEDYIACRPKYAQFLPHSQGRWQKKRFRKAQCPIVERLVCSIMRKGRNNGKKVMAVRIVKHAFEIIHLLTDQNPVQVFVEAVVNCGPREDSTRVGGGGAVRRQARRLAAAASELGDLPHRDGLARVGLPQHQDDRRAPRRRDYERREGAPLLRPLTPRRNFAPRGAILGRRALRALRRPARPSVCPHGRRSAVSPPPSQGSSNSYAIKKKDELERVAKSNR